MCFGPPGSGSVSRYGSGSFCHRPKVVTLDSYCCDFLWVFIFEKWCKCTSVADPWHFGVDPDSEPDSKPEPDSDPNPPIFVIDFKEANKKKFFNVFLLNTIWRYSHWYHFSKIKSQKEVPTKTIKESRFFLLFLLNDRRIQEAQKKTLYPRYPVDCGIVRLVFNLKSVLRIRDKGYFYVLK